MYTVRLVRRLSSKDHESETTDQTDDGWSFIRHWNLIMEYYKELLNVAGKTSARDSTCSDAFSSRLVPDYCNRYCTMQYCHISSQACCTVVRTPE
jgi:hypothetical protein